MSSARAASLILVLLMSIASCAARAPVSVPTASIMWKVWIHLDGPWESPPPEVGLKERTAPVTLIRFDADHRFSMMHCYIIEQDKRFSISNGDGQAISLGLWQENGSAIDATFRLVYETVHPVGGRKYPGPEEKGSVMIVDHAIRFRSEVYHEAKQLDMRKYDEFIGPERAKLKSSSDPGARPPR